MSETSQNPLKDLCSAAVQKGYEACLMDVVDAALGRADEWHDDCPSLTFLRLLRNDPTFQQYFIRKSRARREGK